eukprot:symbB.v1.2.019087.t1/scaffold1547.1/size112433/8
MAATCHGDGTCKGVSEDQLRSLTLSAGPASGHFDVIQLKASLDSRRGPASYKQLQAVMAMKGLIIDHSKPQPVATQTECP